MVQQTMMVKQPKILQKFYIYDPNVPDTLGGLRVLSERDDKGNDKENTRHVLAVPQQVQYWVDQGLLGEKPVGEISESHKKLLAQVTRGRSEDNEKEPARLPKYSKATQSGALSFAGQPSAVNLKKQKERRKEQRKKTNPTPKPTPSQTPPPVT
jgi:hypothetical protein